ncbi:class I SAM-dependent methyltransferase [Phytomonospora endophytica]|uniref:SAM-dependent methyltransferase n=1 Tax=Phytomonospora endophytica TaxID=714109 RepID=A0A841G419_9ACTN|nr:class I SAM-dependent methyltransferase [Phytomonospora endophytica]MBB6038860.1 SAM-dependent methyltransferase [Phytomonospora endophytica]GIG68345.1 methyltransferase [Phytomonospora endophytica]
MYTDAEAAALYDLVEAWNPDGHPADAHYHRLVMAAGDVLDVGCGTGGMLHRARADGHTGRLAGLDPDPAVLARARRRTDVEWVETTAAGAVWDAEFDLAVMASHAFQYLITDEDLRASLAAIRAALRPGGRFAFETRHPSARAWEAWNPGNASDIVDGGGRALRTWFEVDLVEDGVVSYTGTIADRDGTVLRVDRETLRFLGEDALDAFLAEAGFVVETRCGDWDGGPVTAVSREIVTVARRG